MTSRHQQREKLGLDDSVRYLHQYIQLLNNKWIDLFSRWYVNFRVVVFFPRNISLFHPLLWGNSRIISSSTTRLDPMRPKVGKGTLTRPNYPFGHQ